MEYEKDNNYIIILVIVRDNIWSKLYQSWRNAWKGIYSVRHGYFGVLCNSVEELISGSGSKGSV
ncbi:MAG TPA: hypothetical protein DCQ58_01920 [Saprospirales bacterium]|nr:hypothetical protein [Saprospirales bacterium]